MVERHVCSFCGSDIEPGTGKMFIKKDGAKYHFCSHKCQVNMLQLKRVNRNVKWAAAFERHPGPTPPKASNQPEPAIAQRTEEPNQPAE